MKALSAFNESTEILLYFSNEFVKSCVIYYFKSHKDENAGDLHLIISHERGSMTAEVATGCSLLHKDTSDV